ncbi:MAG TPA: hypothetical protein VFE84_09460 [Patescibacteria group bacterium]|nr:hypothetical protein [Patescibacteria group bacterium]
MQEVLPAPEPESEPAIELQPEPTPPPISRQPFPGEGPITSLEASLDQEPGQEISQESELEEEIGDTVDVDDVEEELDDPRTRQPSLPDLTSSIPPVSAYSDPGPGDSSRPWFLLGGAAAVGFAALFLILMAQNPGDAGEVIKPVSEAVEQPPGQGSTGTTPVEPSGVQSDAGVGPGGSDDSVARGEPGSTTSTIADKATQSPPENAESPDIATRSGPVASPGQSSILKSTPGRTGGRESLASGDYLAASRLFGREISSRAGQYTIQLLTACQDETVRRAVDNARGSGDLFILSTRLDGRNCYRVFWGRYPSQSRARDALRRDVPSTFLQDRNTPRITRLGG